VFVDNKIGVDIGCNKNNEYILIVPNLIAIASREYFDLKNSIIEVIIRYLVASIG